MHRNLRFAILDQLMESGAIPRFDLSAFFLTSRGEEYDPNNDYDFAPLDDVADHLANVSLDDSTLCQMTELDIYAGNELQHVIFPQWSGEDHYFDIPTLDGIERCAGLQSLSIQLLPPDAPADITAVSRLPNLTDLSFNGGVLTTLAPFLGCARLTKLEFIVTSIDDVDDNRTIVSGLRARGCQVNFRSPRDFSC